LDAAFEVTAKHDIVREDYLYMVTRIPRGLLNLFKSSTPLVLASAS